MHEEPADTSGAGVEVLICTPYSEVDVPVVQGQRDIPYGVSQIPSAYAPLVMRVSIRTNAT